MVKLAEVWALYEHRMLPGNCSDVQLVETRRAFYAGASSLFELMVSGVSDAQECTPGDEAVMEQLKAELDQFLADVVAGKA